jgi:hypothetical protein
MHHLTVGFANVGRADNADQVRTALQRIKDRLAGYDHRALLLNEIDEGDETSPSDHELVDQKYGGYAKPNPPWTSREPILTKGLTVKWTQSHHGGNGVPNQSPARQLHEVIVDGFNEPDIALLGAHYPAGAHNGDRPPDVRDQLLHEYGKLQDKHKARLKHHLAEGRHVVWGMDCNWTDFPGLHDREKTMRHYKPDYIRAVPAQGWSVTKENGGQVDLPIEDLHKLQWAVIDFRPQS